ncbi:CBO0543 family protein [Lentibacillus jeotgali]|uniref:CBO0543 family protein n=1 Tax=Lentibacillus jeotgali TaxID=558169 RepID=UPI000262880B|nr:CBO0543 family protein [Lentibacillus jeotgali]
MFKSQQTDTIDSYFDRFQQLHDEFTPYWMDHIFLHGGWWIAVLLTIAPWIFWLFYRKKDSTHRLLYAGLFSIIIGVSLDYIGIALDLWHYGSKVTPTFPAWSLYHFALLPVTIMFLIQTKPHIAAWKKGIFYGLLTGFIGEPIFVWAGYYVMTGWEYVYSIPIYTVIYIVCDWLTKREAFEWLSKQ